MNRTRKFLYNTLATSGYQLAAMLMGFITPRLMMSYYGSEINGLVVSINDFINYFKLVEAGLATAAVYSLYKPLADRDENGISAIVSAARSFYNVSGYLFVGITLLFSVIYPLVVPCDSLSALSVGLLVLVMGVSGALEFFTLSRYRVLLTADQKTYIVSLASMASLIAQTAVIAVMAVCRVNVLVLRLFAGLTILLRSGILYAYVRRHYPYVNYKAAPNKAALSARWDALYRQLINSLQQSLGVTMTTLILRDAALVSVYGTYHMVIMGLWGILKMVTTGIYSLFGEMLVKGQQAVMRRAWRDFEYLYLCLCTVIYGTCSVMILSFVRIYTNGVSDADYIQPLWAALLVWQGMSDQLKLPLDMMVTAAGKFRETRHYNTAQVAIAVGLGAVLGLIFGVPGIIIGLICANLVRTALQLHFVPKHITGIPAVKTLARQGRCYLTVLAVFGLWQMIPFAPNDLWQWLAMAVVCAASAAIITVGMGLLFDREGLFGLLNRAKSILKRMK